MIDMFIHTRLQAIAEKAALGVEAAKRMAAAPLKPRKPQKPCDVGLFSDTQKARFVVSAGRKKALMPGP